MARSKPFDLAYAGTDDLDQLGSIVANTDTMFQELYTISGLIGVNDIIDGEALTSFNDTNITLTLAGAPTTALLAATSITAGWTGTLAPARGGTGTGTVFTAGSVVFAGASGVFAQDNTNFFWDDTNDRLGLGVNTPKHRLELVSDQQGNILFGGNGPNISCNAYYNAGWKYRANGFANVVSIGTTGTGDFIVYTSASGLADAAITLLDKFHVATSGAVTIANGLTADTVTGTTAVIATALVRIGSDSTSLFRDTSLTGTDLAVRDSGNTAFRGLRVALLGVSNSGGIFTVSQGSLLNVGDGSWVFQNNAGTSKIGFQTNAIQLSHEAGNNAVIANGSSIFYIGNEAVTTGGNIDCGTADTFKFRNIAKSADASVQHGALTQSGKTTTYNNVATAGWGAPAIYGENGATAQTGDVASVATYTVGAADGDFYISCNVNVTAFTAGTQSVQCTYTDETNTPRTLSLTVSSITGTFGLTVGATGAYEGVPLHIRAKASTAITIKTVGTVWTGTYNVRGAIVQIA